MGRPGLETFIQAAAGRGRHRVRATAQLLGPDILVSITGGTAPHIGSVSITVPRPGGKASGNLSTTSSVYNFPGHKEEAVARMCAERIAAAFNKKTVAVAGIHIDEATREDIGCILKNADVLCSRLQKKISSIIDE